MDNSTATTPIKVLIVEDSIQEILPVKLLLESMGCEVTIGIDGLGAVESLAKDQFDLLVLDWMMPDFNGDRALEYAEQVLSQRKGKLNQRVIPFVAYTGLDIDRITLPEVSSFRFLAHWKKPFNLHDLEKEVELGIHNLQEAA